VRPAIVRHGAQLVIAPLLPDQGSRTASGTAPAPRAVLLLRLRPVVPGAALPTSRPIGWLSGARAILLVHDLPATSRRPRRTRRGSLADSRHLRRVPKFDCDAIEVVTSAALQSDVMRLYRDWFALLNRGHRLAAIAASDTHHVSQFILGQARTYAACRAGDPAAIAVEEI